MKSKSKWLWLIAVITTIGIITIACDNGGKTHTHTWGEWSIYTAANCQLPGEETRSCGGCDETELRETTVNPNAHHWQYDSGANVPTCMEAGSGNRHCTVDGCTETSIGGTYPADPSLHIWQYDPGATIPTCVTPGSGSRHCTVEGCNATGTSSTSYPALGHDFGNWTVASNVISRACERGDGCIENQTLIAYLQSGTSHAGTAVDPVPLKVSIELTGMGTEINSTVSGTAFTALLAALNTGGKLVALDMSGSYRTSPGAFNTGSNSGAIPPGIAGLSQIMSINLPSDGSITSIGNNAFQACTRLTSVGGTGSKASVEIPTSVTRIGSAAFNNCNGLTSVIIPNTVISIDNSMFGGCTKLTSVGGIGSGASVEIPDTITRIENSTFYSCTGLTSVIIS